MKNKQINVRVIRGKLSEYPADAYVLPFLPYHESISEVRLEVANAGAAGIRKFIDHRLQQRRLRLGDVFIVDSEGGKSHKLVNMVCRVLREDYLDSEVFRSREDMMKYALHNGFISLLTRSSEHNLRHIAMPPLCVSDHLPAKDFAQTLKKVLENFPSPHAVEQISILSEDEEVLSRLNPEFA